jgi:flagellar biosynthesis protein FlhB
LHGWNGLCDWFESMANDNKTEQATPQRQRKAREEGQIPRSRELAGSLACATLVWMVHSGFQRSAEGWRNFFESGVSLAARADSVSLQFLMQRALWTAFIPSALVMTCLVMVAGGSLAAQGGAAMNVAALNLKFDRISPASRIKQIFSITTLSSLLKSLVPGIVTAYIAFQILSREWWRIVGLCRVDLSVSASVIGALLFEMAWKSTLVMMIWAAVDYLLVRKKMNADLRMSKEEIREEAKQSDGNPATKGRIRRLQRQARRARMLQNVESATVVVTNPTHFAVALKYSPEMPTPVVVAKGQNLLALELKRKAQWLGIEVVENRPLAQALYRAVEVGIAIPVELYAAVAEVLAFVFRMQSRAISVAKNKEGK